jgi:hypothetical protein
MKHEIAELLPFYANGTLDEADRARVEAELAACAACSEELQELRALAAALRTRADEAPPLPEHVFSSALAKLDAPAAPRAVRAPHPWWSIPARYATAAVLVIGFGATAAAAWHSYYASVERTGYKGAVGYDDGERVFRYAPAPQKLSVAHVPQGNFQRNAPSSPTTVARQHRLAKHARIELLVPDVEAALKSAQRTTRAEGGDLLDLSDSTPQSAGVAHAASLDVEVPAANLDATLDALAKLGGLQNRSIQAEDIDATIVDEEARLRNLRREETALLRLMDRGGKIDEILSVQQSLSDVRGQIEQLEAQDRNDLHRVATSTISITLTEDRPELTPARPGPTARIDTAWRAGIAALGATLIALASTLAWCIAYAPIPLALAAITYAAVRTIRARTPR